MIVRKLEALEKRVVGMMAKDENAKKRFEPAYRHLKAALDAAYEGNHQEALDNVSKFNNIMNETKLLNNV